MNLLVTMSLALDLSENVDSIIVTERSAHFVVIHREMVLLNAPESGETRRIHNFEDTGFSALPCNIVRVSLRRVVEQLLQKVPKQSTICKKQMINQLLN